MRENRVFQVIAEGEKSSSEISKLICLNYYDTLELLKRMEEAKLIIKTNLKRFNFWKLIEKEDFCDICKKDKKQKVKILGDKKYCEKCLAKLLKES